MKFLKQNYIMLALGLVIFCACEKDQSIKLSDKAISFSNNSENTNIVQNGEIIKSFAPETDQIIYTDDRLTYIIADINFEKMYTIKLDRKPMLYESIQVHLSGNQETKLDDMQFHMQVVKLTDDSVYLWSDAKNTGVVINF